MAMPQLKDTMARDSRRAMAKILCIALLATATLSLHIASYVYSKGNLFSEFLEVYREVVMLAKAGMNVSSLVGKLNEVLNLIEISDDESHIEELLHRIRVEVSNLEDRAREATIYNTVTKTVSVLVLASIPVAFYVLFPRVYLAVWFKVRRKWVVRSAPTR